MLTRAYRFGKHTEGPLTSWTAQQEGILRGADHEQRGEGTTPTQRRVEEGSRPAAGNASSGSCSTRNPAGRIDRCWLPHGSTRPGGEPIKRRLDPRSFGSSKNRGNARGALRSRVPGSNRHSS